MGTTTDAHCFACGYDTFLSLGGGMTDPTYAAWPVSCRTCAAVTTADFEHIPLSCEECKGGDVTPPTDRQWWKGDGHVFESWGELTLTSGHYRCPRCGEFELRFGTNVGGHREIMWD